MGLFWDKNKNPAITFKNTSNPNKIRTSYRYYNNKTNQWVTKDFGIKVEGIRSDHYTTNSGTIIEIGIKNEINLLKNFKSKGTIFKLNKKDKKSISGKYLLREVDKTLMLKENILRGISVINGKSCVITIKIDNKTL